MNVGKRGELEESDERENNKVQKTSITESEKDHQIKELTISLSSLLTVSQKRSIYDMKEVTVVYIISQQADISNCCLFRKSYNHCQAMNFFLKL